MFYVLTAGSKAPILPSDRAGMLLRAHRAPLEKMIVVSVVIGRSERRFEEIFNRRSWRLRLNF